SDGEQNYVLDVAAHDASLHRRTDGHDFIRIDVAVRCFAEHFLYRLHHARHARLTAHQHDLVDLPGGDSGGLQGVIDRIDRLLNEVFDHLLELAAAQDAVQVLRPAGVGGAERQGD